MHQPPTFCILLLASCFLQLLENIRCAVGGMVVHNNHIERERGFLPQSTLHGISNGLRPVEDGNHHRGLHSELLLAEVDGLTFARIHQSSYRRQMACGHTFHLYLHLTVARVHIVELTFTTPPQVAFLLSIEELVQMQQLPLTAQEKTKVVEGGIQVGLSSLRCPLFQLVAPDEPQRTEIEIITNGPQLIVDDGMAKGLFTPRLPTVGIHHYGITLFSRSHHTLQSTRTNPDGYVFQTQKCIVAVQTRGNRTQCIGGHQGS